MISTKTHGKISCILMVILIGFGLGCSQETAPSTVEGTKFQDLIERGFAYSSHEMEHQKGLDLCREAARLARADGNSKWLVSALSCQGIIELRALRYDAAIKLHRQVQDIAEAEGNDYHKAIALLNESQVFIRLGILDWAEDRIQRGLRLEPADVEMRYMLLGSLCVVLLERGEWEKGLGLIRDQMAMHPPEGFSKFLATNRIARFLIELKRYEEAVAHLEAVREGILETGHTKLNADLALAWGEAQSYLGFHSEGIPAIQRGVTIAEKGQLVFTVVEGLIILARAQTAAGHDEEAGQSLRKAVAVSEQAGALGFSEMALRTLLKWKAERGEDLAVADLERLEDLKRERAILESVYREKALQISLQAEADAAQLTFAQKKNQLQQLLSLALLAITFLLATIAVLTSRRARSEARLNERIRSDHDRLQRLSEDLMRANWRELDQLNRLTALGSMAVMFAHEIQQPLTATLASVQTAGRALNSPVDHTPVAREAIQEATDATIRSVEISKRLRRLIDNKSKNLDRLDLNEVVLELEELLCRESESRQVDVSFELAEDSIWIDADRIELQQIIVNLAQNGITASLENPEEGPSLSVRTSIEGPDAILEIEDNGPRVEPETLTRMFEPLFTTKGSGMGMGLAFCQALAEGHGGRLSASQAADRGLILKLSLPLTS